MLDWLLHRCITYRVPLNSASRQWHGLVRDNFDDSWSLSDNPVDDLRTAADRPSTSLVVVDINIHNPSHVELPPLQVQVHASLSSQSNFGVVALGILVLQAASSAYQASDSGKLAGQPFATNEHATFGVDSGLVAVCVGGRNISILIRASNSPSRSVR